MMATCWWQQRCDIIGDGDMLMTATMQDDYFWWWQHVDDGNNMRGLLLMMSWWHQQRVMFFMVATCWWRQQRVMIFMSVTCLLVQMAAKEHNVEPMVGIGASLPGISNNARWLFLMMVTCWQWQWHEMIIFNDELMTATTCDVFLWWQRADGSNNVWWYLWQWHAYWHRWQQKSTVLNPWRI